MEKLDYKQKYEEARERCREFYNKLGNAQLKKEVEEIFPELKVSESEDERIRKELIRAFTVSANKRDYEIYGNGITYGQVLAWLEKQNAQKSQGKPVLEVWKDMRLEVYQQASGNRHEPNCSDDSTKMFSLIDIDEIFEKVAEKQGEESIVTEVLTKAGLKPYKDGNQWCVLLGDNIQEGVCGFGDTVDDALLEFLKELVEKQGKRKLLNNDKYQTVSVETLDRLYKSEKELERLKQGEQKPTDRVKPKFHAGDFITDGKRIFQIKETVWERNNRNDGSTYCESLIVNLRDGNTYANNTDLKEYHLWTIQDARNGDILYTSSTASHEVFLFKGLSKEGNIEFYCSYDSEDGYCDGEYHFIGKPGLILHPATKEQRETLFKAMHRAGYEWDAETKELKKIKKQNTTEDNCKISDWDMKVDTIEYNNGYECGKQRVLKYPEDYGLYRKSAWSEEDEKYYDSALWHIKNSCKKEGNVYNWLKSLKDRVQPQPRQEQSGDVVSVIERGGEQWVRICALGEDFIIAAHDYRDGDKTLFAWEEACKIGTFSIKQGYIILVLLGEINAKLKEIGGEPLDSYYWSSSAYSHDDARYVHFSDDDPMSIGGKWCRFVARKVVPF